ncbi:MAG: TIGR03087 family PEP-CTERM/XrtA system glycosyltransferase [Sphingorhabdus sp.]
MPEILFLAHRAPWPPDRGDKIRSFHLLQKLKTLAPVHVGAFADDARDIECAEAERAGLASLHVELRDKPVWFSGIEALASGKPVSLTSFGSRSMRDWVDERLASGTISHVFVFSGQMAQYVPADFDGRFVMDFVDVDSAKFDSYAEEGNSLMRWVYAREGKKMAAYEAEIAKRADASLFVSEAEAELFRQRSGATNVHIVGNGIDTGSYDPAAKIKKLHPVFPDPLVVFTGQMDYRPNIEAVADFAHNAFPAIRAAHPETSFAIVGRNPTQAVVDLSALPGVMVTGEVPDVRTWLAGADVVVAPLRMARGIQNKVLEAMAMAKPVVASRAAAEGIDAQDGAHFRVAASVEDEARIVSELLTDNEERRRLGQAARAHVMAHYGWDAQLAGLDDIFRSQSKARHPRGGGGPSPELVVSKEGAS